LLPDDFCAAIPIQAELGWGTRLASNLTFDRPLVDQTGLQGHFEFLPRVGRRSHHRLRAPVDRNAPVTTLEEALRDQLGIKLVRQKAPVEVLVIDHIDRPTEN
jgi:uncharacterized protein (TIGR03435 family)